MLMRMSMVIHRDDLDCVLETYEKLSQKYFTHTTPMLFNTSTPNTQVSLCLLLFMKADSINGIYDTLKSCGVISKYTAGIRLAILNIHAANLYICSK